MSYDCAARLFLFDPNTAEFAGLLKLNAGYAGLFERVAALQGLVIVLGHVGRRPARFDRVSLVHRRCPFCIINRWGDSRGSIGIGRENNRGPLGIPCSF